VDLSEEDDPTLPAASFEESGRRADVLVWSPWKKRVAIQLRGN
jgi:hypothetical protein